MKDKEIIKAWKNPGYRETLGHNVAGLPEHPLGWSELSDAKLGDVIGGNEEFEALRTEGLLTLGCCTYQNECDNFNTHSIWTFGCCKPPKDT